MNRIFFALRAHIDDYDKLQSDFREVVYGRWMAEENLHVTLCYFGDTYRVEDIFKNMPHLPQMVEELKLSSLGFFEDNGVLYAKTKSKILDTVHLSLCSTFSLLDTKAFIPHVTLMRVKKVKDKEAFIKILQGYGNKQIGRLETGFELIQSHINHPGGATYESIRKY